MRLLLLTLLLLAAGTPAAAQQRDPIPPYVFDVRGGFVSLGSDSITADSLGISTEDLAGHAFGLIGGVQVYPLRRGGFALGLGGEFVVSGASSDQTDPETGEPIGPIVRRRFRSISGQLSLNFGHRLGWSYITMGLGPAAFDTYIVPPPPALSPEPDGLRPATQNFGIGARWFTRKHMAFELDLRFYLTVPADPMQVVGGRGRKNVVVMSAGIGLK